MKINMTESPLLEGVNTTPRSYLHEWHRFIPGRALDSVCE